MLYLKIDSISFIAQTARRFSFNETGVFWGYILGFCVYFAGIGLCSLALLRPHLAKYRDILFAQFGWMCGIILLTDGWQLNPLLQACDFLLVTTAIYSAIECIRLRSKQYRD